MILPNQIKNHEFTYNRGMYKAAEVDEFLEELTTSYERIFRENGELIKKLEILAEKVEEYRNDEDNIRLALLTAQRAADQITKEAKKNAEKVTADSTAQADKLLSEATAKAERTVLEAKVEADKMMAQNNAKVKEMLIQAQQEKQRLEADYTRNKRIEEVALDAIKKEAGKFKQELLEMYQAHITLVNQIPGIIAIQEEEPEAAYAPVYEEEPEEIEEVLEEAAEPEEAEAEEVPEQFDFYAQQELIEETEEVLEEAEEEDEPAAGLPDENQYFSRQDVYRSYQTVDVSEEPAPEPEEPELEEISSESEPVTIPAYEAREAAEEEAGFDGAFSAYFSGDETEEDFSELDAIDEEFESGSADADYEDDEYDMFADDEEDEDDEPEGFGRFFRRK